jgi:hypothetical protein
MASPMTPSGFLVQILLGSSLPAPTLFHFVLHPLAHVGLSASTVGQSNLELWVYFHIASFYNLSIFEENEFHM